MKNAKVLTLMFVSGIATALHAGVIMEDRPVPFSLKHTDKACVNGVIMDERVKTSFGQILTPGTYSVMIEGTDRPGEALLSFSTSPACMPSVGQTKGVILEDRKANSAAPANGGAIRGFQEVNREPNFLQNAFSLTNKKIESSRVGQQRVLTIQSTSPSLDFAFRAKLDVVP